MICVEGESIVAAVIISDLHIENIWSDETNPVLCPMKVGPTSNKRK